MNNIICRRYLIGFILALVAPLSSQPHVTAVKPLQHGISVDPTAEFEISFSEEMDPASFENTAAIHVFGNQSGYFDIADVQYEVASNTLSFSLEEPAHAGEIVTAIVTRAATSIVGDSLLSPFLWSFTAATANATGEFALSQTIAVGSGASTPYFISCADLNGDGFLDLVTATKSQNMVSILLNDGSGSFSVSGSAATGLSPDAVVPADFDMDGDIDLVSANSGGGSGTVLQNDGDGNFTTLATLSAGSFPHGVSADDLDGDGDIDIIINNLSSANLTMHTNNGDGTFSASTITDGNGGPEKTIIRDFDNDGDKDLGITHFSSGNFLVKENNGFGAFPSSYTIPLGNSSHIPEAGDFNNDGYLDAASPHNGASAVSIMLNDGLGALEPAGTISQSGSPWSVTVCDIDADGVLELLVCKYTTAGEVAIWENDGNANFSAGPLLSTGRTPHVVVCGDFNNDGAPDLATANDGANTVSVFINTPVVDIDPGISVHPTGFELFENYPNPFNPGTIIRYSLMVPGVVNLSIYNLLGEKIRTVVKGRRQTANMYSVSWDGKTDAGESVGSGVYFYRLEAISENNTGLFSETKKMILTR